MLGLISQMWRNQGKWAESQKFNFDILTHVTSTKRGDTFYDVLHYLTLIYPAHFEDVPCQSGVNHIFEG